jgi:Flp pilus assembly protein TadG
MTLQRFKNQRGVAVVETAITLLPFFVIMFAVVEAGWFFYVQATLTHAAREGARMMVRPITATNTLMTQDEVRAYVADFLTPIGVTCPTCIVLTEQTTNVCAQIPNCDGSTVPQPMLKTARVEVTVPYTLLTLSWFQSLQFNLKGISVMREETSDY